MMRELERVVLLNIIDTRWREHLYEMDYLQEGIYLRSYAQKDPITEYRREAFDMFEELTSTIQTEFVRYIYRVELVNPEQQQRRASGPKVNRVRESHGDEEEVAGSDTARIRTRTRSSATRCLGTRRARAAAVGSTRSATAPWHRSSGPEVGRRAERRRGRRMAPAPSCSFAERPTCTACRARRSP